MPEPFVFCLHQIKYRYILGNETKECVPNIYWFAEEKKFKINILHECKKSRYVNRLLNL
jgi:hypothetical protein